MINPFKWLLAIISNPEIVLFNTLEKAFGIALTPKRNTVSHIDVCSLSEDFFMSEVSWSLADLISESKFDGDEITAAHDLYQELTLRDYSGPVLVHQLLSALGLDQSLVKIITTLVSAEEIITFPVVFGIYSVLDRGTPSDKLSLLFSILDLDGGGSLGVSEVSGFVFMSCSGMLSDPEIDETIDEIFRELDTNTDGEIQFTEFIECYREISKLLKLKEKVDDDLYTCHFESIGDQTISVDRNNSSRSSFLPIEQSKSEHETIDNRASFTSTDLYSDLPAFTKGGSLRAKRTFVARDRLDMIAGNLKAIERHRNAATSVAVPGYCNPTKSIGGAAAVHAGTILTTPEPVTSYEAVTVATESSEGCLSRNARYFYIYFSLLFFFLFPISKTCFMSERELCSVTLLPLVILFPVANKEITNVVSY